MACIHVRCCKSCHLMSDKLISHCDIEKGKIKEDLVSKQIDYEEAGQLQLLPIAQEKLKEAYSLPYSQSGLCIVLHTETLLQIVIRKSFAVGCKFLSVESLKS